jgi:heat shock protein HtpX
MTMVKRIFLFLLTNILVMFTLSIVWMLVSHFMGINPNSVGHYGGGGAGGLYGIQTESLMMFCLVWGMGGAFISLAMSRIMAKMFMGVKVIDPNTHDHREMELVQRVYNLARSAGLSKMPEVGIYDSPEINAFATGPTKNRALVAVSTGLLSRMNSAEVEGVLGHEVAHIANGDMVTMTLVQGVVNAFVMFFARIVAQIILRRGDDEERSSPFAYMMLVMVLEMVFMMLGMIVVSAFSRYREYRADAGGARLAGRENMIGALKAIKREVYGRGRDDAEEPNSNQQALQTLMISSKKRSTFMNLFSTHPDLDDRIARLAQR